MKLAPADAVVAAESFPRRWRALFARATGDGEHTDVLARSGASALADQATSLLARTAAALPVLHDTPTGGEGLDGLEAASHALAAAIRAVQPDEWTSSLTDNLASGIDEAASLLRRAERAVDTALSA